MVSVDIKHACMHKSFIDMKYNVDDWKKRDVWQYCNKNKDEY